MSRVTAGRVREVADKLYDTFACPKPEIIDGCPCCIDSRGTDILLTKPLRQISGQELWRYVTGVFLTVGSERDFRYLLPRIFEVAALTPSESPNSEIVLGKLRLVGWETWPTGERDALLTFIESWFDHAMALGVSEAQQGWVNSFEVESIICGAAISGVPVAHWIAKLERSPQMLEEFIDCLEDKPKGFWEDAPLAHQELRTLLDPHGHA